MKIRSFQLKQGQFVEIQPKPGESEMLQKEVSKRFGPNGEDRLFQKMKARYKPQSKRKLRQAA